MRYLFQCSWLNLPLELRLSITSSLKNNIPNAVANNSEDKARLTLRAQVPSWAAFSALIKSTSLQFSTFLQMFKGKKLPSLHLSEGMLSYWGLEYVICLNQPFFQGRRAEILTYFSSGELICWQWKKWHLSDNTFSRGWSLNLDNCRERCILTLHLKI